MPSATAVSTAAGERRHWPWRGRAGRAEAQLPVMPLWPNSGTLVLLRRWRRRDHAFDDRRTLLGHAVHHGARPHRCGDTGNIVEVLDGNRDAVERAQRTTGHHCSFGLAGRVHRLIGEHQGKGVDHRVTRFDAAQVCLGYFDRRQIAATDALGKLRRRQEAEFIRRAGHNDIRWQLVYLMKIGLAEPPVPLLTWSARRSRGLHRRGPQRNSRQIVEPGHLSERCRGCASTHHARPTARGSGDRWSVGEHVGDVPSTLIEPAHQIEAEGQPRLPVTIVDRLPTTSSAGSAGWNAA